MKGQAKQRGPSKGKPKSGGWHFHGVLVLGAGRLHGAGLDWVGWGVSSTHVPGRSFSLTTLSFLLIWSFVAIFSSDLIFRELFISFLLAFYEIGSCFGEEIF